MLRLSAKRLSELAGECGLEVRAILLSENLHRLLEADKDRLMRWQEKGFAGDMAYMLRSPELFCNAERFLSNVVSLVSFSVLYALPNSDRSKKKQQITEATPPGHGRVARYAWGRDYHRTLKKRIKVFVQKASEEFDSSSLSFRVFTDAVPLLERAIAKQSGRGFIGRNTMYILPGTGSFTFLAELLWNVDVEDEGELKVPSSGKGKCGRCSECLSICPTKALVCSHQLDARKCVSYLTIEKKTYFSQWERQAIGSWLFGCDECQAVCPFNHANLKGEEVEDFSSSQGCGPFLHLASLLRIRTRDDFLNQFKGTPLMRTGREALLRNTTCVMANTSYLAGVEALITALKDDPSDLVRSHARSALEDLYKIADGLDLRRIKSALV